MKMVCPSVMLIALVGTGCPSITPQDNFKRALYDTVGRSIDNVPPYEWPHKEDLIDTTPLPNGNIEYRYKYLRTCRYIFEVNPATHLIVGARFEGKDTDCVINP